MKLLVTIYASLAMGVVADRIICRPEDHMYYHEQHGGCLSCEKCNPGEEQMDIQKWTLSKPPEIFTAYGPTQCPPCVTCRDGYFNPGRAYECTRCRNCTLHNKYEVEKCTWTSNAVCDGVFQKERFNVDIKEGMSTTKDDVEKTHAGFIIAISCLCVFVFILCAVFARMKYKQYMKNRRHTAIDAEEGSFEPLMSDKWKSKKQRQRHNSEPAYSYSNFRENVKTIQRHFSDPGDSRDIDFEIDGQDKSVSFDERIDRDCLISLSNMLCEGSLFISFARRMGLSDVQIDTIKHDYNGDGIKEVSYQVLAALQKRKTLINKREAIRILKAMNLPHIIEQL